MEAGITRKWKAVMEAGGRNYAQMEGGNEGRRPELRASSMARDFPNA